MPGRSISVFCRTDADEWRRVLHHDPHGLDAGKQVMTFAEAWEATPPEAGHRSGDKPSRHRWEDVLVALPDLQGPAWAYALTYRVHQKETRLPDTFFFEKRGSAENACQPIPYRPALDYEAEVALLLHRSEPDRFGFLFANDLTDRAKQARTFDRLNPAPGFSAAKSFPGALRAGPLLVIGDAAVWPELEVRLEVNGELRQQVRARECLMTPREFHQQIFTKSDVREWALVLTGTAGGTIFQSPTPMQRFQLLVGSGFSRTRAREAWLERFQFLRVGDRLEMKSEMLGMGHAIIVPNAE